MQIRTETEPYLTVQAETYGNNLHVVTADGWYICTLSAAGLRATESVGDIGLPLGSKRRVEIVRSPFGIDHN